MYSVAIQRRIHVFLFCLLSGLTSPVFAQSFTDLPSIGKSRLEASVVDYRDDIYVFNGFGAGIKIENTVEKFDAGTQQWSQIGTTSVSQGNAVTHNGIVRHGVDVWLIGGRIGDHPGRVSSSVSIYNLETGNWRQGPDMPFPVAAGGAALVDNQIHWFGGLDPLARCDVDFHFVYDLNKPSAGWQDLTSSAAMPEPRNHFSTVVANGIIYAIGGQNGHDSCPGTKTQDVNWVHAFDPDKGKWTRKADLPKVQSHAEPSTFEHQGYIYMVGGKTDGNRVLRYDPSADRWDTVLTLAESLLAPIARIIDGRLLVAAGGAPTARQPVNKVRLYDIKTPTLSVTVIPGAEPETEATTSVAYASSVAPIVIEAEYFDIQTDTSTHQWVHRPLAGASNEDAMSTTPDSGALSKTSANSPMLSYLVYFDKPGTYYLWVRGWGDTDSAGNGNSDSLHAGINGSLASTADKIDSFPPGWHWSRSTRDSAYASLTVPTKGVHSINVWMREDGLAIDKLLLTMDQDYIPVGQGPAYSGSGGEVVSAGTGTSTSEGTSTSGVATALDDASTGTDAEFVVDEAMGQAYVAIELENYTTRTSGGSHEWIAASKAGASGDGSMVSNLNIGTLKATSAGSPMLSYRVEFAVAGTYQVWVRGWGDSKNGEGKNDSVHVGINGTLGSAQALQNFPSAWSWSNEKRGSGTATITVPSAGIHTINVWMREDGLIIDRLILTTDIKFDPDTNDSLMPIDSTVSDTATEEENAGGTPLIPVEVPAGSDVLVVELESFDSRIAAGAHEWISGSHAGAQGGGSVVTNLDNGALRSGNANSPQLNYVVNFDQPGTYYVWLRGWGDTINGEGKSDSVHVGINGTLNTAQAMQNFPAAWAWSSERRGGGRPTITVSSAGKHTVNVWMREDGLHLDALLLTRSASYSPSNGSAGDVTTTSADSATENTTPDSNTGIAGSATSDHAHYTLDAKTPWVRQLTSDGSTVLARHETGGVAMNGRIYLLGGRGSRAVSVFDPATRKWTKKSSPPMELNHFQPVVWNNKIWIVGAFTGRYPDETSVTHVYSYTPSTDTWRKEHMIPEQRRRGGAGAVLHEGKILLVGGNNKGHRDGAKPWVDLYDPATGKWQVLPDAPSARDHATIAVSNGKLVAAAGRKSQYPNVFGNTVASTDVLNLNSGNWTQGAAVPTPRAGTMTVAVGDEVVVIGGETSASTAHKEVQAYNVTTNRWRSLSPLAVGRHSGAAMVLDRQIHVISGSERRGGSPESTVHEVLSFQ